MPASSTQTTQTTQTRAPTGSTGWRIATPWLLAAVLLITLAAYAPVLSSGITNWDDPDYLQASQHTQGVFTRFDKGNYHPLTMLSLALDRSLPVAGPRVHHAVNLLLHALVTGLVFALAQALLGGRVVPALAALVFGIHPLHVESVAWISGRKDLLYALFYFAGLLAWLRHARAPGRGSPTAFVLTLVCFVLSLLSKGMAVAFPLSLVALDLWLGRPLLARRSLLEKLPFFGLSAVFGGLAIAAQRASGQLVGEPVWTATERLALASYGYAQYWLKLALPLGLSAFHPYPAQVQGGLPLAYYAWLAAAAGVAAIFFVALRRGARMPAFAVAFHTANLVFVLQLFAVGGALWADRYSYVASFGFCLLIAWACERAWKRGPRLRPALVALSACWLAALALLCYQRSLVWHDSLSLWNDVLARHPDVAVARLNRGVARFEVGDLAGARADLDEAVRLWPQTAVVWAHRGSLRAQQGELREALADLDHALTLAPDTASFHSNRGHLRESAGDRAGAREDYDRATALRPDFGLAWYNRAGLHFSESRPELAVADAEKAVALLPGFVEARLLLAQALLALGRTQDSCPHLAEASRLGSSAAGILERRHCRSAP